MKTYKLTINGDKYEARILEYSGTHAKININGADYLIQIEDDTHTNIPKLPEQEKATPLAPAFSSDYSGKNGELRAPLPGVIVSIPVKEGDTVKQGQTIIIIEAMKMQSEISAPVSGIIGKISVKERTPVQEGDLLMQIMGEEIKAKPASKREKPQEQAPPAPRNGMILAPIPGTIMDVRVELGQMIEDEQVVVILEAMKMESEIHSNQRGKVKKIHVSKGSTVAEGDPLIELEV